MSFRPARIAALAATFTAGVSVLAPAAFAQAWKAGPPPATPPGRAAITEAKERYKKGLKLYQDEAIDAALIELERAYELAPNFRVLYNIGQVARSQPDYATSLRAFERYLTDGDLQIPARRRAEVEKDLFELRERVAIVTVVTNVEGASILIDDVPEGKSPLAQPLLVNAGRRKITVAKETLTATKVVTLAGKDSVRVELPLGLPKPVETPPPPPPPPPPPALPYTWIGWVVTGALVVGTGITGGLAIASANDLKSQRFGGPTPPSSVTSLQTKTRDLAITTDALIGASVAAFGGTLATVLVGWTRNKEHPRLATAGETRRPEARPALELCAGPRGVKLVGSF